MLHHLRPHYAKAFRCIGSDCEDTCCHGLDVVVDQASYERLHSISGFASQAEQHLAVIDNPSESKYARIQLTTSFTCPFLSPERLCSIQKEHGEYYLADICANYPRVSQRIDGLRETALLLSCPEAARLVLLNPDLLPMEDSPPNLRYQRFTKARASSASGNGSPHRFLWEIREFTLLLLRDRSYPLWQRLFLMGMFCKRLKEITAVHQLERVPEVLGEYAAIITHNWLGAAMDAIPLQTAAQMALVREFVNRHLGMADASHVRFRECVQDFLDGIHYTAGCALEACVGSFEESDSRYYQPFMQARPYILENYLVNYVFRTRFPYGVDADGNANDAMTEYLVMGLLYGVIKGLLIGMAGQYKETFSEEHVVKLIQSFGKAFEQCPQFSASEYLGLANPGGMALLLRDNVAAKPLPA